MKRNKLGGQSILQYTVLIILVVAAFMAMRNYMVGAIQDKYRQSADVFGEGEQYEEGVTTVTPEKVAISNIAAKE